MAIIKTLEECTLGEAVKAWNLGFEGYYFDAASTEEKFMKRIDREGLSPAFSIVAFKEKEPMGIILNGIKESQGRRVAWNGGTGIAAAWRNQGYGQLLMEHILEIYKKEGVNVATLEAISENQKAIRLYEKLGYRVSDDLEYLELTGVLGDNPFKERGKYQIVKGLPQEAGTLSFYKGHYPWQTHWERAAGGEAVFLQDPAGNRWGYAYFRRSFDQKGRHTGTILYQCESDPDHPDADIIVMGLLEAVFGAMDVDIKRIIINLPKSSYTYPHMRRIGFKPFARQVFMVKEIHKQYLDFPRSES
ncbi:GNAT family N-acetyltransferase [Mesobacillus foraminis]|uniref:GNAT family N-acetyltransferase n=1 Tax=Mesobacillus foraminis TaxID=279826 RepID=UPI000EF4A101|nr:GNAT family N-acetyltransferase [Mesobacillus foraminis]